MTAQNTQGRGANAGPTTAATNQDAVRDSEKLLEANTASIPDGPNVAPSPVEHLAAQGKLPSLSDGPNASNTSGPSDTALPPAEHSAGKAPVEPVAPAEQDLVDEQRARDSADTQKTNPPPSGAKRGGERQGS